MVSHTPRKRMSFSQKLATPRLSTLSKKHKSIKFPQISKAFIVQNSKTSNDEGYDNEEDGYDNEIDSYGSEQTDSLKVKSVVTF